MNKDFYGSEYLCMALQRNQTSEYVLTLAVIRPFLNVMNFIGFANAKTYSQVVYSFVTFFVDICFCAIIS